jgi:predicted N-acetyltransferase YhbS
MQVEYVNELSIDDYNNLRKSAGWREVSNRKAEIGLKNSTFIVVATVDEKPVGMARIVGDGGYFVLVVDVIVLPQWQGKGIGKNLMKQIMAFVKQDTLEKENVFVSLIAAPNRETFYEQFGFKLCPDSDLMGTGMYQYICK